VSTLLRMQTIFRDVLDEPSMQLAPDMSIEDTPDWDSVAMIQIVLAVEAEFDIRLTGEQVEGIRTVADIVALAQNGTS